MRLVRGSLKLEDVLSSRGRVKVLRIVMRLGEVNITRIVRESGLNYKTVKAHLDSLVAAGILSERRCGRLRMYSVNYLNPSALVLKDVLLALER